MVELEATDYEKVHRLFDGFDYSLSIHALIEGNNPGRMFVDDAAQPRTAFVLTVEGYLLAGDDDNPRTNAALRRLLEEQIFTGEVFVNGDWSMSLAVHPETWEARLPELIPTHEVEKIGRYHYLCRAVKLNWRDHLPEGYTVHRVDRAYYYYIYDEVDHLAELGWYYFKQGGYDRTTRYYEQVFALRDDNPDYYYHLAAAAWGGLGSREMTLKYLNLAVDHGWAAPDYTRQVDEFRLLHGTPEWDAVLARMQGGSS